MKKFNSLKKNEDFQKVYHFGKSKADQYLVLYARKRDEEENKQDTLSVRVGISVSKKVGNSVVRHHLKRLIRESYMLHCAQAVSGYDLVFIAREKSKDLPFRDIEKSLDHLMKRQHLYREQ